MKPAQAYEELRSEFQTSRELEASVLLRAAHKLDKCAQGWAERGTQAFSEQLGEAVQYNQKLWTLLQVEVANPENQLPRETRLNVLRLGKYVDRISMKLFANGELSQLGSLARINKELAAGLLAGTETKATTGQDDSVSEPGGVFDIVA